MYPIRAVLIDSRYQMVRYVVVRDRAAIAAYVGGPCERAGVVKDHSILVDEEGRLKNTQASFELEGVGHHIGQALVVGPPGQDGEWTDSQLTAEDIRTRTRFFTQAMPPEHTNP